MNTNTLTAHDIARMVDACARIEALTNLLRRAHFDVPYTLVYDAVGAVPTIRDTLLRASLSDVAVETERRAA